MIGFCVLRNADEIRELFDGNEQVKINADFHFGGYAKSTSELDKFCNDFREENGIEIEPVYTGKMFFGLCRMISEGRFNPGSRILVLHTGGLQYITED